MWRLALRLAPMPLKRLAFIIVYIRYVKNGCFVHFSMALARLTLSYEENTWHMITSYYWWGNTRMPKAQCALQLARAACDSLINLMHFVGIHEVGAPPPPHQNFPGEIPADRGPSHHAQATRKRGGKVTTSGSRNPMLVAGN